MDMCNLQNDPSGAPGEDLVPYVCFCLIALKSFSFLLHDHHFVPGKERCPFSCGHFLRIKCVLFVTPTSPPPAFPFKTVSGSLLLSRRRVKRVNLKHKTKRCHADVDFSTLTLINFPLASAVWLRRCRSGNIRAVHFSKIRLNTAFSLFTLTAPH